MVLKIEGWTREGEKGNTLKERKVALQKKKRRRRWTTNRLKKYLGLENVLGWKKGFGLNWKRFWVEAKTFWAVKKKGNTSTEKKKWGAKDKRKEHWTKAEKGALTRKEKREQEKCGAELKEGRCWRKKEKAETKKKRGLNWEDRDEIYFQHLFSFKYSQKNYDEFVYVEFNF